MSEYKPEDTILKGSWQGSPIKTQIDCNFAVPPTLFGVYSWGATYAFNYINNETNVNYYPLEFTLQTFDMATIAPPVVKPYPDSDITTYQTNGSMFLNANVTASYLTEKPEDWPAYNPYPWMGPKWYLCISQPNAYSSIQQAINTPGMNGAWISITLTFNTTNTDPNIQGFPCLEAFPTPYLIPSYNTKIPSAIVSIPYETVLVPQNKQQLTATKASLDYTLDTSQLPAEFTAVYNSDGTHGISIKGKSSQKGSVNLTMALVNDKKTPASILTYTLEVQDASKATDNNSSNVNGLSSISISSEDQFWYQGYSFGYACEVSYEGSGTLSYSATGLPEGVTINSQTGLITGTPTSGSSASITVTVTDGSVSASTTFSLTQDLKISISGVPLQATVGTPYQFVPIIKYALPTYNFTDVTLATGNLPDGCQLDPARGIVYGTPTKEGNYTFTLKITDGVHSNNTQFTIEVQKSSNT